MLTPASLEDYPHIAQARVDRRIRLAQREDTGVVVRTIALSLAALIAPVIAGTVIGMATRDVAPRENSQSRDAPFSSAAAWADQPR